MVREAKLSACRLHKFRSGSEIVSWHAGKQMVLNLELKASMKPVQPWRTAPIHCPSYLWHSSSHDMACSALAQGSELYSTSELVKQEP